MPNEMMRPCTLPASWKQACGRPIEPFDAMEYLYYKLNFSSNSIGTYGILLFKSTGVLRRATFCCGEGKGDYYDYVLPAAKIECHLLSLAIAEALNAPIKVTRAVLNAIKDAGGAYIAKSILVDAPDYSYNLHFDNQKKAFTFRGGMAFDVNEQDVPIYTVQADCPLALKVLLQFNTEGEKYHASRCAD